MIIYFRARSISSFVGLCQPTTLCFILRSLEEMARNFAYGQHLWEWKGSGPPVCAVCGRYLSRSNCHATCGKCYSVAANSAHNRFRDLIRSNPMDLPRMPAAEPTTDPSASDSGAGTAATVGPAAADTATRRGSRSRTRSRSPHR